MEIRAPKSLLTKPQLHRLMNGTMRYTWRGVLCNKSPFDFALYSLLLWRERPGTIIEIGTKEGGSTLWLSDLCRLFELGTQIISIDLRQQAKIDRPEVTLLKGDAFHLENTLSEDVIRSLARPLLVIDDSAHTPEAVLAILRFMDPHLRVGEYAIVEDGVLAANPRFNGGPIPGIEQFLLETDGRYEIDSELCDFFGYNVTFNPNGYLKKVSD